MTIVPHSTCPNPQNLQRSSFWKTHSLWKRWSDSCFIFKYTTAEKGKGESLRHLRPRLVSRSLQRLSLKL